LQEGLGIKDKYLILNINEFTEDQVQQYLGKLRAPMEVPEWLPSRPLLLGYLITHRLLSPSDVANTNLEPDQGWNLLVHRICEREAKIEANIDADSVRGMIQRLATVARGTTSGLGPIFADDLIGAFRDVMGHPPDDMALMLLMRLPGIGPAASEDGSRSFVDEDYVDVLSAGDLVRFIQQPYTSDTRHLGKLQVSIGELGAGVGAHLASVQKLTPKQVSSSLVRAIQVAGASTLPVDIANLLIAAKMPFMEDRVEISDVVIKWLALTAGCQDVSRVTFADCLIGQLELDAALNAEKLPRFRGCWFVEVLGRVGIADLPPGAFDQNCEFEEFLDQPKSTSDYLDLHLTEGVKVLLTVLKKLFVQRGRGRKENALFRGLDHRARRLVPDVLSIVQSMGVATKSAMSGEPIWLPKRSESKRIRAILAAPNQVDDELLERCRELS
jgi:hypothetical protein